ncbi:MAG: SURF1 family protein [Candidatus Nanopelagicales bacterium]
MSGGRAIRDVLLTPRWILRTVAAALLIAGCVAASVWQYHRTADQVEVAQAANSVPVGYEELVAGGDSLDPGQLGRNVIVTGESGAGRTFIRERLSPSGEVGYLVVDGVHLADGRVVAVLRGWVPRPEGVPESVGEPVTWAGRLQPDENFYPDAPVTDTGPLLTITHAGLAQQWGTAPAPGYVTATGPAAPGVTPVAPVVGTDPDVPFPLQNAFYSIQWLIFAAAVGYVWFRFLREDLAEVSEPTEERVSL